MHKCKFDNFYQEDFKHFISAMIIYQKCLYKDNKNILIINNFKRL